MTVVNSTLLIRRLFPDGVEVLNIVDTQVEQYNKHKYRKVVRIGDRWRGSYLHVPHAMLFDAWSASAELALGRFEPATLRLLRADTHFRRWQRSLAAERIVLEIGERNLIVGLVEQFIDVLSGICQEYGYREFQYLLLEEYEQKSRTFQE